MSVPVTVADIVTAYAGREAEGLAVVRDAAVAFELHLRAQIDVATAALGIPSPFTAAPAPPAPPARKRRAPVTVELPAAPEDDGALLTALLGHLRIKRATSKGLAAKFAGLTAERVYEVLITENAKATRRAKLEPNGRNWVAVSP